MKKKNKKFAKSVEFDIDSSLNIEYKVHLENINNSTLFANVLVFFFI